jgi:inhibitor of cysteine peptidase
MADVYVTARDNGGVVSARVGDRLVLHLAENPSTGYVWAFDALDESRLETTASQWQAGGPGVGTGGERAWTLTPRRAGTTDVALKRWRPWAGEGSVIERVGFTVDIAPG